MEFRITSQPQRPFLVETKNTASLLSEHAAQDNPLLTSVRQRRVFGRRALGISTKEQNFITSSKTTRRLSLLG